MSRSTRVVALLLMATACTAGSGPEITSTASMSTPHGSTSSSPVNGHSRPPNIVMILADDQRFDTLQYMPNVTRDLVQRGELFSQAFVSNSLCCPSRAAILTGNYSHTTHVYTNTGANGGWHIFNREAEASTIATWLDAGGYRTALVGKYMNKYGPDELFVPPGWDRWMAFDQREGRYYDYTLNRDGSLVSYGSDVHDYSTDLLADGAVDWLTKQNSNNPFFLLFAPFAPHKPSEPAPRDVGTGSAAVLPQTANFNETDVRDKPNYIRRSPVQNASLMSANWRTMVESLGAVDDAVGRIVDTLSASGQLKNTMIVYTSDNGILFGEHRWTNKLVPYEESIHVPLVIRYDPLTDPKLTDDHLVVNVDFAPTFASLAGVDHPATEGRDLTPILGTSDPPWRRSFLLEHLWNKRSSDKVNVPTYCGVRTTGFVFIHYSTGFEELYDLARDPYELQNLAGTAADATIGRLRSTTRSMCSPLPPGMPPF